MAGGLAAEWMRIPDGNGNLKKVWLRDSTARRDIAQLQTDVSGKADAATTLAGYGITDAYTQTQVDGMIPSVPSAYTSNPSMDGTASPGSSTAWARGDHVHPHDSTKADVSAIPTKTSDLTNDSGFITSAPVTSVNGQTGAVTISVPTKTSDLTNDSGFLTSAPVASVNGQTGTVSLSAADVGALPSSTTIPTKTSDLTNDSGYITSAPVSSVNSQTGVVVLTASDVGALPSSTAIPSKTSDLTNDSGFITASAVPSPSSTAPAMDGTAAAGSSTDYARADHVHPTDTSRQAALTSAQLAAVNSGITANDLAVNDASVLCTVTPTVPTLDTGTHYTGVGGCWYYKIGHRVCVHVGVEGLTSGSTATLWYLPTGYRPLNHISVVGTGSSMTNYVRLRISPEGRVFVNANAASACVYIEFDAFL